jgi:hypothetical protein
VVSPTRHFGYPIGRPGHLHRTDQIYGYFEALAASSPRVRFQYLGATEEGDRIGLVQVGSEGNLARLEAIRSDLNRLADPRVSDADEARRIIAGLPVVYTLFAGLHSPETGPPEMVMELAYRLAVSDDPLIRTVRDSAVVFIVPVAEPTGRSRVVDWYRRHGTAVWSEEDRIPGPPYWGKYIFHDINRDGMQLTARTTQELVALFEDWKFPFGHDLHESVPYLYSSTGTGPYNPTVDPITISEWQWLANYEVTTLTTAGLPGVWTHGFYDGWYPGYLLWVPNVRNAHGRFYETFGSSVPNTIVRTLPARSTSVEWYRPNPPRDTTLWSLRNNTNYMQSGVLKVLGLVAENRTRVLQQYRTKAENSLRKGRTEKPHAYVIPADQPRRADAAYVVDLLRRQGIEVHRATAAGEFAAGREAGARRDAGAQGAAAEREAGAPARAGGERGGEAVAERVRVRVGDYVVRMDQPYRNFILTLMQVQNFPQDAPTPYDDVAWTFPLMFNLTVRPVDDPAIFGLGVERLAGPPAAVGTVAGRGTWWAVRPVASAHSLKARLALGDVAVEVARDSLRVARDVVLPPGAWLVPASALPAERAAAWAAEYGLQLHGVGDAAVRAVARHALRLPRVAVLHSWRWTQDAGWVRYALDQAGLRYTYLGEDRLKEGRLRERFDVILFPSQGARTNARTIFQGVDSRFSPLPYTRTDAFPSAGFPDSTPDMTGGMGYEGLAALRDFVTAGGTLITLGTASTLPLDFGLVREVALSEAGGAFVPGSLVGGRVARPAHPITYGYDAEFPLYHRFGPYFNVPDRLRGNVVLRYAERAPEVLLSGFARNPAGLAGEPALVVAPLGTGHLVLFGFNPLHRYQTHGNFALVWNALLNWDQLGVGLGAAAPPARVAEEH